MGRAAAETTHKRRDVILRVIEGEPGLMFKEILERLRELHNEGKWPVAPWLHARQDPYEVGLRQHLKAMERAGLVERHAQSPAHYERWAVPVRKHAVEVARLKSEGKTQKDITEELGLSRSLVSSLINDPTGAKERERKRNYCPGCGTKKEADKTWCPKCVGSKAESLMPPKDESAFWQEAMVRSRRRGVEFVIGVTPDLKRLIRVDTGRGRLDRLLKPNEEYEDVATEMGLL